jgi:hypothetical protein
MELPECIVCLMEKKYIQASVWQSKKPYDRHKYRLEINIKLDLWEIDCEYEIQIFMVVVYLLWSSRLFYLVVWYLGTSRT